MAKEKTLETRLKREVEKLGGLCLKYHNSFDTSYPDRIILLGGGRIAFAEIKTTGKKPTKLQQHRIDVLKALGFKAEVVDSDESLNIFMEDLQYDL